jgi:hypothetical protein
MFAIKYKASQLPALGFQRRHRGKAVIIKIFKTL